jgi:hypothetical protein
MSESTAATELNTYRVALRCASSARFLPEEAQHIRVQGVDGAVGPIDITLQTRWQNEGFEAPTPRELWVDALVRTRSLDQAASLATSVARLLTSVLAFTANVQTGIPEVHLAYDSTPGHSEREFLEVFLPDERGIPREGRSVKASEFNNVLTRVLSSSESERLSRGLQQYELALRHWYLGGEWLALAHLYMAVEALTKSTLRKHCADTNLDEAGVARLHGIDPDDFNRPRWRPALDSWVRRELIFRGDEITYNAARSASDGLEHGFMELNEIHRRALESTEQTFGYVRRTVLQLLELAEEDHRDLTGRPPRDVGSLRKMVRGHFVDAREELAPPGEEHPYLEWTSSVKTLTRTENRFKMTFDEKFTVRCAPGVSFRGQSFEARGRREPGAEEFQMEHVEALDGPSITESSRPSTKFGLEALSRANHFASAVARSGAESAMAPIKLITFGLFAEQVSLFEAVHTLLQANRPVEALVLMKPLLRNTGVLQAIAVADQGEALAVRVKLDGIGRQQDLYAEEPEILSGLTKAKEDLLQKSSQEGWIVPDVFPELESSQFLQKNSKDLKFISEVAEADDLAIVLHTEKSGEGSAMLRTQVMDPKLWAGTAGLSIAAMTASTVAFADELGWTYDSAIAEELEQSAEKLQEDETS